MGPNWRQVYVLTIILRFVFGLSNSYIHPDEHFQNFEVLTSKFFGFSTTIPWEFSDLPLRSLGPLYMVYGPLLWFLSYFNVNITPLGIWYLLRVEFIVVSWLVVDMCLYRILPTKPERIKSVFFTLTSYITLIYQSHCFSNSVETPLVMVCLMLVNDLRFDLEVKKSGKCDFEKLFYLGLVVACGIFNRITFACYFIIPSFYVFKYIWKYKMGVFAGILGFLIPTISFIAIDTYEFTGQLDLDNLIITPWNNLKYNSNMENLSQHGIHPYYTHLIINLPQILGPSILLIAYKFKNTYYRTTPFLTLVSGLLFMSVVPHQELRFLIPLLPVATCCFDFNYLPSNQQQNDKIKKKLFNKPEAVLSSFSKLGNYILWAWYIFNFFMCILMGILHQGGVVPTLDHLRTIQTSRQIWWRTYSPPTWILGDKTVKMVTVDNIIDHDNLIIDAMGSDNETINDLLTDKSLLIAPIATINCDYIGPELKLLWKYDYHLDLDHLNFTSLKCLQPGLGVYELL